MSRKILTEYKRAREAALSLFEVPRGSELRDFTSYWWCLHEGRLYLWRKEPTPARLQRATYYRTSRWESAVLSPSHCQGLVLHTVEKGGLHSSILGGGTPKYRETLALDPARGITYQGTY